MRRHGRGNTCLFRMRFNLRREAAPHATAGPCCTPSTDFAFQSQTRSRSTCDIESKCHLLPYPLVSISDEKPLHMRPYQPATNGGSITGFNLRREAAPHATNREPARQRDRRQFQSQTRSRSTCDNGSLPWLGLAPFVSISDEKPLHMRRISPMKTMSMTHLVSISDEKPLHMRHSRVIQCCLLSHVSISDEKPLHMRRSSSRYRLLVLSLVSISDEKPLHMPLYS